MTRLILWGTKKAVVSTSKTISEATNVENGNFFILLFMLGIYYLYRITDFTSSVEVYAFVVVLTFIIVSTLSLTIKYFKPNLKVIEIELEDSYKDFIDIKNEIIINYAKDFITRSDNERLLYLESNVSKYRTIKVSYDVENKKTTISYTNVPNILYKKEGVLKNSYVINSTPILRFINQIVFYIFIFIPVLFMSYYVFVLGNPVNETLQMLKSNLDEVLSYIQPYINEFNEITRVFIEKIISTIKQY